MSDLKVSNQKSKVRVAAIVVTYNRLEKLKLCLEHLSAQTHDVDIIVVDNASSDDTPTWIKSSPYSKQSNFTYLKLELNLGGAGGFEVGMTEAQKHGYDWLWLLDDDAFAKPDALQQLLQSAEASEKNVGVLGCKVVLPNGQLAPMNKQARYAWHRGTLYGLEESQFSKSENFECDSSSFVGFLVKSKVVNKVGLPRADYFIHFDDVEYSLRIRKAGYRIIVVPASVILHDITVLNEQEGVTPVNQLWKLYYNRRNELYTSLRMTKGLRGKAFFLTRRVATHAIRNINALRADHPIKRLKVEWQSFFDGLFARMGKHINPATFK